MFTSLWERLRSTSRDLVAEKNEQGIYLEINWHDTQELDLLAEKKQLLNIYNDDKKISFQLNHLTVTTMVVSCVADGAMV